MTELGTYVALSTEHLTPEVGQDLVDMGPDTTESRGFADYRSNLTCCQTAYGHWVRVLRPTGDSAEEIAEHRERMTALPECLADCMRHAAQFGARWIQFDQDVEAIGMLRIYQW